MYGYRLSLTYTVLRSRYNSHYRQGFKNLLTQRLQNYLFRTLKLHVWPQLRGLTICNNIASISYYSLVISFLNSFVPVVIISQQQ